MCTVLVSYDTRNKMAVQTMNLLSMIKGVKIDEDAILTDKELKRIEKAKKSGIRTDIEELQKYLRSQYAS